jgi:hypothetical protein
VRFGTEKEPEVSRPGKAVKSWASVRVGRRTWYVLPWRSLAYGAVSPLIVFAVLLAVDRLLLGWLESRGWTAGEQWARHNKLVEENHRRKTTTNECELRQWQANEMREHPGSAEARLAGENDREATTAAQRYAASRLPMNRRKILVLGDSFVWGPPYLTLNHLWWRQLAIELERRGYRDVDVVAAGHPGWSTRRQLECANQLIGEVQPDAIIWGYVTNDPDEKLVKQIFDTQDKSPFGQRIRMRLKRVLPNLMFKFESLRNQKLAAQYAGPEYGYAYADWELKLLEGENFERYQETVKEVGQLLHQSQTPAFLLTLPSWPCREYFEPRYAPVLPPWQAAGVTVVNTLDEFIRRYGNAPQTGPEAIRWGINPADSHPGPQATHFYAVMAADFLEQTWPELLGRKDASQPHELMINDWLPFDLNVQQGDKQAFAMEYPGSTDQMPRLPLSEPTALVALRFPLPIEAIHVEGAGLTGFRVWISTLHPHDPYDDQHWQELRSDPSARGVFRLPPDLAHRDLAEIRFRAEVTGADRRLHLTLVRNQSTEERN